MAQATMYFPPDFLWGTATAAHQVEGNNRNNDWWQWERDGAHIHGGAKSGLACNWWADAEADLDRAADIGTNAHRLSVEWSRIEPEPSVFDDEALARYREILQAMHQRGIEPMVTLHHFSNPLWLVEKRDFDSDLIVDYFRRYTAQVVKALGDLIPKWVTINEPMIYAFLRYVTGAFPAPAERGWSAAMRAVRHMLRCHAVAYETIKSAHPEAMVGVAKNNLLIEPLPDGNWLDDWWARRVSWLMNDLWMACMVSGRLRWPVGRGVVKGLAGSFDFVGINYYSRFFVTFPPRGGQLYQSTSADGAPMADGDFFEVYPEGIFKVIKRNLQYQKPIYVTENGLPDSSDRLRPAHLLGHLREIWRAISFNYPVMGYYHWTLTDNFEWERGWSQRFGLIELDPETQTRRPRPSAQLYREICQTGSVSSDMAERYAPGIVETIFPGQAPQPDLVEE